MLDGAENKCLSHHHIHFPAPLAGCFTLSGLLDKSWSIIGVVSSSLSGQRPFYDDVVLNTDKMLE